MEKNIAIFASGSGTNAENIVNYFKNKSNIKIKIILTNKPKAFVIERAKKLNIPVKIFNKEEFYNSDKILQLLKNENIDLVVLAGFLWLIPQNIIDEFEGRIINIHPALLPKYGGKGMYGNNVHKAVIEAKEKESGITIHYVNKKYDDGAIIFQAKCKINPNETPDSLAEKIHSLEYKFYPKIIEQILDKF
jgi:phosphoribosylglycinamide formyltransferase-1